MNEDADASTKEESREKVKILIQNLKKKDFSEEFPILNEFRNHLLLLHETLFDSLKRLSLAEADMLQSEVQCCKWDESKFKFYLAKLEENH